MVPIYAINSFFIFMFYTVCAHLRRAARRLRVLRVVQLRGFVIDYMGGENEAKAFFAAQPPRSTGGPFIGSVITTCPCS